MKSDGNVLYPEFRRDSLSLQLHTDILYADDFVLLVRITYVMNGEEIQYDHFLAEAPDA